MSDLFEKASREKLRFSTPKGLLTVEDLWGLPLQHKSPKALSLDSLAKSLARTIRENSEESFVQPAQQPEAVAAKFKLDIVKHIIQVLMAEQEKRKAEAEVANQRQRILEAIHAKQEEELKGKSLDELKANLDALDR